MKQKEIKKNKQNSVPDSINNINDIKINVLSKDNNKENVEMKDAKTINSNS